MGSVQGDRALEETAGSVECDNTITTSKPVNFRYYSRMTKSTVVAVEGESWWWWQEKKDNF